MDYIYRVSNNSESMTIKRDKEVVTYYDRHFSDEKLHQIKIHFDKVNPVYYYDLGHIFGDVDALFGFMSIGDHDHLKPFVQEIEHLYMNGDISMEKVIGALDAMPELLPHFETDDSDFYTHIVEQVNLPWDDILGYLPDHIRADTTLLAMLKLMS